MWTPLPLVAALALTPAQTGSLNLTNVRSTYGELGGTRADTPLLPGDVLFVGFDIEGISVDPEGRVVYTMAMDITDKAGKSIWKQEPAQKVDFVPLGGTKLPARAFITVGLDQPAGEYALKVTVTDQTNKATKAIEKKFNVLPKEFGLVAVYTSVDRDGQLPAPTTGIVGQSFFVQFGVVGFARDPGKKQPSVSVEMMPLDEAGKPTLQKPNVFNLDAGVEEKDPGFSVRFLIPLTRTGKFTIRLKATDRVANKTYTYNLPIAVVPSAN
jgi:hypothetical protein